jgi:hypothetical protein
MRFFTMKLKLFLPLLAFGLSVFLYSCESNDAPIVYETISPASTNKVLVEIFTNTSCIPCVVANQYLDAVTDTNIIIIRTHTTLYPNDPYYLYNPTDNNARQTYYAAANANPKGFLLGTFMGNFNANNWTASLNTQLAASRSMGIIINKTYNAASRSGNVNLFIKQNAGETVTDLVLHVALTESNLLFNAPNGESVFEQVLRDLMTAPNGDPLTVSAGQTVTASKSFTIPSEINDEHAEIIVFTQSTSTKEVFGVERVKLR